jgi:hypothetical protein
MTQRAGLCLDTLAKPRVETLRIYLNVSHGGLGVLEATSRVLEGGGSMFTEIGSRRGGRLLMAAAFSLLFASSGWAISLDKGGNVNFRGRVYSQFSIRAEQSPDTQNAVTQANPEFQAGQLVQNRFFYNPELDAALTDYTTWMRDISWLNWLAPDDFSFRVAAWGFYDGIYDYGSSQYNTNRAKPRITPRGELKPFVTQFGALNLPLPDQTITTEARPCTRPNGCVTGAVYTRDTALPSAQFVRDQLAGGAALTDIFEPTDARNVFAHQQRVNELYLNYTKGPLFVRLGRQSISWGEADTIALLDANNPFDVTLGVPGVFQDLDEARIPLWTLRTSYQLPRKMGPFASSFIEGYWVPGAIDNSVAVAPFPLGVSPYGQSGIDPHLNLVGNLFASPLGNLGPGVPNAVGDGVSIVLVDLLPEKKMKRSRGGVRVESIIADTHTASAWWYRTFNNAPVARLAYVPDVSGALNALPAVSTIERGDIDVFGIADTFFIEAIDSIARMEAEYFLNEMSFLDWRPAAPLRGQPDDPTYLAPESIRSMANIPGDQTTNYGKPAPRTNHLRWELGLDRFFFMRFLNPSNSFLITGSFVGDYNIDATVNKRYGFGPGRPTKAFEALFQVTTQTDYLHGKLTPRITTIYNYAGAFAINAKLDYRITDYLLAGLQYAIIDGAFHQIGFFRDYDQVALRVTYQLN